MCKNIFTCWWKARTRAVFETHWTRGTQMQGSPSWAPQTATRWQILTNTIARCVFIQIFGRLNWSDSVTSIRSDWLASWNDWTKIEWFKVVGYGRQKLFPAQMFAVKCFCELQKCLSQLFSALWKMFVVNNVYVKNVYHMLPAFSWLKYTTNSFGEQNKMFLNFSSLFCFS